MTIRIACFLLTATLVAGCSGATQPALSPTRAQLGPASASTGYLYVGDLGTKEVDVFSYPQDKKVFTLSGFATVNGLCTDFNGNVWVSDGYDGKLDQYLYGQKKAHRSLQVPGYFTLGCSVDLKNGDLAVTIQSPASNPGGVAIFKHAKGKPRVIINTSTFAPSYCAYDYRGNLFFDGIEFNGTFFFAEIPRGKKAAQPISLPQHISNPGGVQYDGNYIAVGDQGFGYKGSIVYEFSIKGTTATEHGSTSLGGSQDVLGFWIGDGLLIGANIGSSPAVEYWNYPSGGTVQKTLTGFSQPVTVTVAKLPSMHPR